MAAGYVYVLINQSMPGLIKVGCTLRDSRARARELFTTGLPTPFQVAFETFSEDHERLEADIHAELRDFRVTDGREFFRYPLDKAIQLVQRLNGPLVHSEALYVAEDILPRMKSKYPSYLRPDIVAVRIVQSKERVWLETTEEEEVAGYLKDQVIRRSDLAFICEGEAGDTYFRSTDEVSENARKFVEEFGPFSIMHTTDLFHEEACHEVADKYNPHKERPLTQQGDKNG